MGQFWTATKFNVILKFCFCMNYLASLTTFFLFKVISYTFPETGPKMVGQFLDSNLDFRHIKNDLIFENQTHNQFTLFSSAIPPGIIMTQIYQFFKKY